MKFFIKDFISKCEQIRNEKQTWEIPRLSKYEMQFLHGQLYKWVEKNIFLESFYKCFRKYFR